MENILIYLNDSINLIYLISLSILIAIMIIISKKNELKFSVAYTKNIQKYLNLNIARNYLIILKFKKIKLTNKYQIHKSNEICWVTENNKIVEINSNYLELCNEYNFQEVIDNNFQLIPIRDNETGLLYPQKEKVVIDGKQHVFKVNKICKKNSNIYSALDITNEENHEEILNKQNETNLHLMNQLTDPVTIYAQDGSLVFFNMAFKKFASMDEEYLKEKPNESDILDTMRYKDLIPTQINFSEWKKKQLNIYKTLNNREQWWYLPDGRAIRVLSQPNPLGGVTHIFENHTDRLALENETRLLSSIQEQTIDNLSEGIALFGTDGRVKLTNPKFNELWNMKLNMDGVHIEYLIDALANDINKNLFDEIYTNIVSTGITRRDHSGTINNNNDKAIYYKSSILPDGSILYTFTDITDSFKIEEALKEKNEALIQADKIKTIFMNNISYELRAPLQNIIGFSELLEDRISKEAKKGSSEYIYNIKKSGNELRYQINQILEITSLESGKISLKYQEISRKKFLSLVQDELYQLNFLDYTFKIEERDVKNTTKIYIDTKCIPRIFAGVIKIFNKKNNFEDLKEVKVQVTVELEKKSHKFVFNLQDELIENEYSLEDINDEYIYSRGDIESTIIQKYIEYFNGEIEIHKQYNRIVVKLPKKYK